MNQSSKQSNVSRTANPPLKKAKRQKFTRSFSYLHILSSSVRDAYQAKIYWHLSLNIWHKRIWQIFFALFQQVFSVWSTSQKIQIVASFKEAIPEMNIWQHSPISAMWGENTPFQHIFQRHARFWSFWRLIQKIWSC